MSLDIDDVAQAAATEGREVRRDLRQTLLSGLVLTVPFFITVLILSWVLDAVSNALGPLVGVIAAVGVEMAPVLAELLAAAVVLGVIFAVGLAAQHGPDTQWSRRVDALMEDIPGVGSIYTSVERMSEVMVEGDTESFRDVKLVEFPRDGSFAIAFLTADTPPAIEAAAGCEEMRTVFVPMAPNPVMGGHLLNLPTDRVYDVDLTVEEGMEAIMTTGLAIDDSVREDGETDEGEGRI